MPAWRLEIITPEDLDTILAIDFLAFKSPWKRNLFLGELSCDYGFGYSARYRQKDQNPAIIAYVFLRIVLTELHIIRIAVAEDFRARGVATWLLQQCFKLVEPHDVDSAYIEVRPSNKAAIALYRSLDFHLIGTRPNYYPESKEDALVMKKQLKERI